MNTQVRVITHKAHEKVVADAIEEGGFTIVDRGSYKPLKGISFVVEYPKMPITLSEEILKRNVLRWLKAQLGDELFFVVMRL
ncbi:MAG TPA: hypothetical protein VNB90_17345 [Cytophagaceae bacterium]|nr:hypothetical protein [Cytophagaceae bacterium]